MSGMMTPQNLALAATVFQAAGVAGQGAASNASAQYQAAQLDQRAGQSRAASQRHASEERQRARLVTSSLQARAGGGGMDPTVVRLAGDIAAEGEYRALSSLYEGEDNARGDEMASEGLRRQGRHGKRAGSIGAVASIFGNAPAIFGGGK